MTVSLSPLILIVGKELRSLTDRLQVEGYDYYVLRDATTTNKPDKKLAHRIVCDFTSKTSVLTAVATINQQITVVMTLYENYVLPTAWINEQLGLPGMPVNAALACTDKFLMRQAFTSAEGDEPISPDFAMVETEDDVRQFAADHQFPLILKPANLVKSLLVTKSDTLDDLLANYTHTAERIGPIYGQYAPNRTPRIIIEEFLEGSLHSVAAFADHAGTPHLINEVVDLESARSQGFSDNFIYSRSLPSALSAGQQAALYRCATRGVRALGMKNTPAHVEIILTAKGPRIIEIGARNGGYRERMYKLAKDIDIIQATVDCITGKQPALAASKHGFCAVIELFPHQAGAFQAISQQNAVVNLASCSYFALKAAVGQNVGPANDGYKRCAIVTLNHSDRTQFEADFAFVRDNADVLTVVP